MLTFIFSLNSIRISNVFNYSKIDYQNRQSPLVATSKIVPVPETLMSPDCPPPNVVQGVIHTTTPKSTESMMPNQKVSSIKTTKGWCISHNKLIHPLMQFLLVFILKKITFNF